MRAACSFCMRASHHRTQLAASGGSHLMMAPIFSTALSSRPGRQVSARSTSVAESTGLAA